MFTLLIFLLVSSKMLKLSFNAAKTLLGLFRNISKYRMFYLKFEITLFLLGFILLYGVSYYLSLHFKSQFLHIFNFANLLSFFFFFNLYFNHSLLQVSPNCHLRVFTRNSSLSAPPCASLRLIIISVHCYFIIDTSFTMLSYFQFLMEFLLRKMFAYSVGTYKQYSCVYNFLFKFIGMEQFFSMYS